MPHVAPLAIDLLHAPCLHRRPLRAVLRRGVDIGLNQALLERVAGPALNEVGAVDAEVFGLDAAGFAYDVSEEAVLLLALVPVEGAFFLINE